MSVLKCDFRRATRSIYVEQENFPKVRTVRKFSERKKLRGIHNRSANDNKVMIHTSYLCGVPAPSMAGSTPAESHIGYVVVT